jgi:hypothetical protein
MNWKKLFNQTLSVKIKVGDRVCNRRTGKLGTVYQTATLNGTVSIPALSVKLDDGTDAQLVPAEEYHKAVRQQLLWVNSNQGRQYER